MPKRDQRIQEAAPDAVAFRQTAEAIVKGKVWDRGDPYKQFIRRFGWLDIIQGYHQRRIAAGVPRPLRFFTLPGENATDIGLLWFKGFINRDGDGNLNVAICDHEAAETVVTNLSRLGNVLAYSSKWLVEALNFDENLIKQFPFDVINMDLTKPLISEKKHFNEEAIARIFRLQRGQSFLLLLTTKPDTNPKMTADLLKVLNDNLLNEPEFLDAYRNRYNGTDPELCRSNLVEFVQIVYPKILARYGRYYGYKLSEQFIGHYKGPDRADTMVCHSFEFEQLSRKEPKRKYEPRIATVLENEIHDRVYGEFSTAHQRAAIDAYGEFIGNLPTHQSTPVDTILEKDEKLKIDLTTEAIGLLNWWESVGN